MADKPSNFDIISELVRETSGQGNIISLPRIYLKIAGDVVVGLFLSQCVWYSDKGGSGDGWFFKSNKEWQEEIGLSYAQIKRATAKLEEMGILHTKLKKAKGAPTTHYYVDMDRLTKLIFDFLEIRQNGGVENRESSKSKDFQESEKSLTALTPTSTETTLTETDSLSLREQAQNGEMTPETELAMLCGFGRQGNAGIADPSQDKERFFRYRDEAIQAVKDITKVYPNETQRGEIAALSAQPDFDFDLWQQSIRSCEMSKVKPGNVSCYIDTYRAGGDYAKMCRQRQNGGKGTTVVPIDPAPSHTLPDLSPDPLVSWWRLQLTMLNPAWKAATPVSKENGKLVVRIDQPGPRAHLSLPDRLQAALLALDGVEELEVIP